MAKQTTTCERCDGTFDGTPSGWLKHQQTDKHNKANPIPGDGVPDQIRATLALREATLTSIEDKEPEFTLAEDELAAAEALGATVPAVVEAAAAKLKVGKHDQSGLPPEARSKAKAPRAYELSGEATEEPTFEAILAEFEANADPLDERPDTLDIAQFRPFDFPPKPQGLQELSAAVNAIADRAAQDIAKYRRYVRYGELHSPKNLPKYQRQLAEAEGLASTAAMLRGRVEQLDEARYAAHYARVQAWWAQAHSKALKHVDKGLFKLELEATSMRVVVLYDGEPVAVVNGPRMRYEGDTERVLVPASVTVPNALTDVPPPVAERIAGAIVETAVYAVELNDILGF